MGPVKCLLLVAVWMQVSAIPLSSKLSDEEEKVTRCILEVLAESLSTPGSDRVSSSCLRVLKEDERLISILRHQHLLRELEDLTHQEKSQQHGGQESSEEEELRKRANETPIPAPKRDTGTKRSESEESKEFEKIEKVEIKEKEHGTSAEEKAKELLEEEENEKRNAPMKRAAGQEKRAGKEVRGDVATKRKEKKHFSDESEEDSEEGEHDGGYHGNSNGWYHRNHEGWEEKKRGSQRRMAEDPSQEETAQFESEDKGMKYFNTKTHMQGYHGEEKRHIHHPEEVEVDRERGYNGPEEDEIGRERYHPNGRPENHGHREEEEEEAEELEEMEEREEHRSQERDIQEVEEELRKAAERLQEIHQG
ncbi:coiled-coil domain-containing glutamate-rich protein 2 [Pseudophryne corroboree]|uniref:coiled-coil domain-containing glutamate-rich protein 2 n=1 Tax=Pseudophryne corroboree TaxID=495146 RepID=UPI0030812765